jgi:hypothetical protein
MKNLVIVLLLVIICLPAIAQKRINKEFSDFTSIKVGGGVDLYLTQGNVESIEIEVQKESTLENLVVEKEGKTLVIRLENSKKGSWFKSGNTAKVKAFVAFKELEQIKAGGGSDVFNTGILEFKNLHLSASGGSDVKLSLKANELTVKASGGSDVILEGYAAYFNGEASGGSDIKGAGFETEVSDVKCSGGSDIHIKVNRELNATASGGSDVMYYGTPEKLSTRTSGGSDIKRK